MKTKITIQPPLDDMLSYRKGPGAWKQHSYETLLLLAARSVDWRKEDGSEAFPHEPTVRLVLANAPLLFSDKP